MPFIEPFQSPFRKNFVEVWREGTPTVDRFGNKVPGNGAWVRMLVLGWAIRDVQETAGNSVLRTIKQLVVYCSPDSAPTAAGKFRLPDGSVWLVDGGATDFNHGPWWQPKLVSVTARKVEG